MKGGERAGGQASEQGMGWDPVPRRRGGPLEERVCLPAEAEEGRGHR